MADLVTQVANKYGIDPAIFRALTRQESGGRQKDPAGRVIRSPAGAIGETQLMPATAKGLGVNPYDKRQNLEGGAKYLAQALKRTGGNYHEALSIYNSGRPDAYKDPNFAKGQTYNYVRSILAQAGHAAPVARGGSKPTSTTRTVGGVDNSKARAALIAQFLGDGPKADPVQFALGIRGAQDVPGRKVTTTTMGPTSSSKGSGGRSKLLELFWQGQGGIDVKNGVKEPQGFVSGHTDHVHVAAGPRTIIELGHLAQHMGLHVGENPYFTGKAPAPGVHVNTSNHYKIRFVGGKQVGEAIDVSGDPRAMAHYAAVVAHKYGIKVR